MQHYCEHARTCHEQTGLCGKLPKALLDLQTLSTWTQKKLVSNRLLLFTLNTLFSWDCSNPVKFGYIALRTNPFPEDYVLKQDSVRDNKLCQVHTITNVRIIHHTCFFPPDFSNPHPIEMFTDLQFRNN